MLYNLIMLDDAAAAAGGGLSSILMIVALIAIFYFMMIRPQQKQQKKIRNFREGLQEGDRIITAGGIHGKIVGIRDDSFMVDMGNNVKVRVDKNSVYPSATDAQADAAANNAKKDHQ